MNIATKRTNATTEQQSKLVKKLTNSGHKPVGSFGVLDRPLTDEESRLVTSMKDDRTVGFSFAVNEDGTVNNVNIGVNDWRRTAILGQLKTQERRLKIRARLQNKLIAKGRPVDTTPAIHIGLTK